jgi:hypothetical protein
VNDADADSVEKAVAADEVLVEFGIFEEVNHGFRYQIECFDLHNVSKCVYGPAPVRNTLRSPLSKSKFSSSATARWNKQCDDPVSTEARTKTELEPILIVIGTVISSVIGSLP